MSTAPATAPRPAAPAVIRKIEGASESPKERLIKKHLPAWVISGAVHVVLIATLIMLDGFMPRAEATPADDQLTVVAENELQEEKQPDLTNPDIGLDPELPATVDVSNITEQNVVSQVVQPDEPVGVDAAMANPVSDFIPPQGISTSGLSAPGLADAGVGNVMAGGGLAGTGFASEAFNGRTAAGRHAMVQAGGGNSESEAAVARGLIWLARQQRANGSWVYDGDHSQDVIAATGMALLPFLAAGQTHKPAQDNKYQKTVAAGLNFLISQMGKDGEFYNSRDASGKLTGRVGTYAQGIATIAICEAYGMTGDKRLLYGPALAAIKYLESIQGPDGSWGYGPKVNGDTSIVGWQIQALQSGKLCRGLPVSKSTLDKARVFLDKVSDSATHSRYGYNSRESARPTLSAVGLLCRYYIDGWGPNNPSMAAGVEYLLNSGGLPGEKARFDMYYLYYATQVLHFYDGPEWREKWNPRMRDMLIKLQVPQNKGANGGSWDPDLGIIGRACGRLGTTCLCLLTLEVYYRHLPLYKRDTGGLKVLEGGQ